MLPLHLVHLISTFAFTKALPLPPLLIYSFLDQKKNHSHYICLRESLTSFLKTVNNFFFLQSSFLKNLIKYMGYYTKTCFSSSSKEILAKHHSDKHLNWRSSYIIPAYPFVHPVQPHTPKATSAVYLVHIHCYLVIWISTWLWFHMAHTT